MIILIAICLALILVITSYNLFLAEKKERDVEIKQELNIQSLINDATPGKTIHISSGTYYESIIIEKPLTIIGEDKDKTIIDGKSAENVIMVTADNVKLENITIRNSGGYKDNAGIKIVSDNNLIKNCIIYRTKTGIYFDEAKNSIVSNCHFYTNGEGIYFSNSANNIVDNSEFQHNAFGIHAYKSNTITIKESYIHTNGLGIYSRDSETLKIIDSAISDNNQDGGGCWIFDSKNIEINNCNIDHNGAGIKLKNTDAKITNSKLYFNMYLTIHLIDSENVVVSNCEIRNCFRTALKIQNTNCQINQNNIIDSLHVGFDCDKKSNCDISNNWWGSCFGPSLSEIGKSEKITWRLGRVKVFPWSKTINTDVGSNWKTEDVFTKSEYISKRFEQIQFGDKDTDLDGVPDWWEDKWGYDPYTWDNHANLDPDEDGLNNIEECYTDKYGSNPFFKDVFIEVDWLKSNDGNTNKVSKDYISKAVEIFKNHDINLHIDLGELDGGGEITVSSTSSLADLRDIYWDYFLENDLDNPRKGIFHYVLVMNENPETYSGFVFFGWDHLDSMGLCIQTMYDNNNAEKSKLIIYGIVHELGHQMGLLIDDFEGIDNDQSTKPLTMQFFKQFNYKSVMNYQKYLKILSYSDGTHGKGDFDDWSNLDFSFFKNTNLDLN
jgi:parallel beta-helix repeat protein